MIHTNDVMDRAIDLIEEDMCEEIDMTYRESSDEDEATRQEPSEPEGDFQESYEIQDPFWDWEQVADWKKRTAKYTET